MNEGMREYASEGGSQISPSQRGDWSLTNCAKINLIYFTILSAFTFIYFCICICI